MGFWKDDQGRRIGDGPLDAADEFLSTVATEYREQFGKLPTLDEVLETIRLQLAPCPEEYIKNGEQLALVEIKAKTKRRPKRQVAHPGDVVVIPLKNKYFAYGHLTPQNYYMEFFNVKTKNILPVRVLAKYSKISVDFQFLTYPIVKGHWKIIGNIPWKKYKLKLFIVAGHVECDKVSKDKFGFIQTGINSRRATEAEMRSMPEGIMCSEQSVVEEVQRLLKDAPKLK